MLVAMTYNVRFISSLENAANPAPSQTYLFGAILVGSFIGHFLYEEIDYPWVPSPLFM